MPSTLWTGTSGGVRWSWTARDITANTGPPAFSLKRRLFPNGIRDGFVHFSCSARPLSLFGTLLCYRCDERWDRGDRPSVWSSYGALDARNPAHPLPVTEVFGEESVRQALWTDPALHRLALKSGIRSEPATALELAQKLRGKMFGGDLDTQYSIPSDFLKQWCIHHLEGDLAAVWLCVAWGTDSNRSRSTEIRLLLRIPSAYRHALAAAACGKEGFLAREAARRFPQREAVLADSAHPSH